MDDPIQATNLRPRELTQWQALQAKEAGHISSKERARRRRIPTFPIDNVTRDIVADRDDGVYVEAEPQGKGYRVHITIADVAAHIKARSPLATLIWQRATTLYFPGRTEPMTERELEELLSLEHGKERLGMTITVTLDHHFQPVHTNFTPVITTPDNTSYGEVHARIQHDPQFRMMNDIAAGIRAEYFGSEGAAWRELMDKRRWVGQTAEEVAAQEMVATYMLLANHAVAEFFSQTGLPFMYRNFDEHSGDERAAYSTEVERHTALEKKGLKGAYCHVTSPIRRAPDYFNGLMMHYAVEIIGDVHTRLIKAYPNADARSLNQALWGRGAELVQLVATEDKKPRPLRKKEIRELCAEALQTALPKKADKPGKQLLLQALQTFEAPPLPYSKAEFQAFAEHINAVNLSPEMRAIAKQTEKHNNAVDVLETAVSKTSDEWQDVTDAKFSSILAAAAQTGEMPRRLFDETMARLRAGRLDDTEDYFSIFILAQAPGNNRWLALKRAVATDLKRKPGQVNALFDRMASFISPATLGREEIPIATEETLPESEKNRQYHAYLVTMRNEMGVFATPFYSIGHDMRSARSHARFSFLESYAFSQLEPLAQALIPNRGYAELDAEGVENHGILSLITEEIGATMVIEHHPTPTGRGVYLRVEGGELSNPIEVDAIAPTSQEALHIASRRLLRHPSFKQATSIAVPGETRNLLNPHEALETMVQARGGTIEMLYPTRAKHGTSKHMVEIIVKLDGKTYRHTGEEPNIHRAERLASVKMLNTLGWNIDEPATSSKAQSWVSDAQASTKGAERQMFGEGNVRGGALVAFKPVSAGPQTADGALPAEG